MDAPSAAAPGATVVISHRVRPESVAAYEAWLGGIGDACRASAGFRDLEVIRPAGEPVTYTVVIRFASPADAQRWMGSPERDRLIAQASSWLAAGDAYGIHSGLDFWF